MIEHRSVNLHLLLGTCQEQSSASPCGSIRSFTRRWRSLMPRRGAAQLDEEKDVEALQRDGLSTVKKSTASMLYACWRRNAPWGA
jgi:hypothetical protein